MKTLVQFGAGAIGRGFIAPLFCSSGWQVVFVDVAEDVVAAMNATGSYEIEEVSAAGRAVVAVQPVAAIQGQDITAVAQA